MTTKEELIIKGAELTTQKRKRLDEVNVISTQIKKWEQDLLEFSQKESISTFEIVTQPKDLENLGQSGAFQIKTLNEYESITKKTLVKLCVKFYTMMFPEMDILELEQFAKGQANSMWKDRETTTKTIIERTYPTQSKKVKKLTPKTLPNDQELTIPSTYEEFMNSELGKAFETAIKHSKDQKEE